VHFWELGVHFGNLPGVPGERGVRGRCGGFREGSPDRPDRAGGASRRSGCARAERGPVDGMDGCPPASVSEGPVSARPLPSEWPGEGASKAVGGGVARREVKGVKGPQVLSLRGASMGGT
jgi:hypothetical protein